MCRSKRAIFRRRWTVTVFNPCRGLGSRCPAPFDIHCDGWFGADIPALVDHALAGRLDLDVMVSAERGLDDLPAVLDRLEEGAVLGREVIRF